MKIQKVSETEINLAIDGRGYFNIMFEDWGGDYPGVDIEFISANGMKDTASKPRVMLEFPADCANPVVRIWDDPDSEDYTHDFTFNMKDYEMEEK